MAEAGQPSERYRNEPSTLGLNGIEAIGQHPLDQRINRIVIISRKIDRTYRLQLVPIRHRQAAQPTVEIVRIEAIARFGRNRDQRVEPRIAL